MTHQHPYHLVDQSPWPLTSAISIFMITSGLILWFHTNNNLLFFIGIILLILTIISWWRDIIREATFQGNHTLPVNNGLRYGMILFITSEICFFFAFFWAFFHSSLAPTIELGVSWPPTGINPINPFLVPLLNTAVLLSSGITVTWAHHSILSNNRNEAIQALFITSLLGLYFTALQAWEYFDSPFTIADSIYGSTFFVATGFHGFHVLVGTTFLIICFLRLLTFHFSDNHHFGFEAAAWYWHFVDVVWLFLYVCIYWWGS
uniref:cytochrome c oxidase subunit III n=1 Tax=Ctenodiscus crispatus TaxID=232941 RepID=UPI0023AAAB01|nr:cytochrome c oxidase subunit III [Ctenodiscus crispatus]WCI21153.1 Cytochrome c oxidase subunit 3 [Ctenodiscus crispatus]